MCTHCTLGLVGTPQIDLPRSVLYIIVLAAASFVDRITSIYKRWDCQVTRYWQFLLFCTYSLLKLAGVLWSKYVNDMYVNDMYNCIVLLSINLLVK